MRPAAVQASSSVIVSGPRGTATLAAAAGETPALDGLSGGGVRQATTGAAAGAAVMGRLTGCGVNRRHQAQGRDCGEAQEHTHFGEVVHFIFHNFF